METEIKLLFGAAHRNALLRHPLLAAGVASPQREQSLSDTYFDTADFLLRHSDVGLRVRCLNGSWIQTLKAGGGGIGGMHKRSEWELPVAGPLPELPCLRDLVDDKKIRREILTGNALRKRLVPIFKTNVTRTVWEIELADGARIGCALDHGKVASGAKNVPINEIELELKSGNPSHLFDLALARSKDLPLHIGNRSKADSGYALLAKLAPAAVKATSLDLSEEMNVEQSFQAITSNRLTHMQDNADGVSNRHDIESVHQMRVGMRRLHSALGMFNGVIALPLDLQSELDWLATELGDARDWDVLVMTTLPAVAKVAPDREEMNGLQEMAKSKADGHHIAAAEAVQSQRYTGLMLNMTRWVQTMGWHDRSAAVGKQLDDPVLKFARKILKKDPRRLRDRARQLRTATPESRHRVRIAAKKTRHAAEFFDSLFAPKSVRPYISGLTSLQDELGLLNDAAVADRLLTEISAAEPKLQENAGFVKGFLAARAERENRQVIKRWKRFKRIAMPH